MGCCEAKPQSNVVQVNETQSDDNTALKEETLIAGTINLNQIQNEEHKQIDNVNNDTEEAQNDNNYKDKQSIETIDQTFKDTVFGYIKSIDIKQNIPAEIIIIIIKYYLNGNTLVYVIGDNFCPLLGLNNDDDYYKPKKLELQPHHYNIAEIYNGSDYSIYSEYNNINYFSAGYNFHGQCCLGENSKNNHKIKKLTKITSFHKNIKIKKIFCNINAKTTFWMDTSDKIYANGLNDYTQIGLNERLVGHTYKFFAPVQVNCLKNVADIQSAYHYTLYLDKNSNVYSCGFDRKAGGHAHAVGHQIKEFTKITGLNNKNIITIATGNNHSLFLSSSGMIYCCGWNMHGQLGLGHTDNVNKPIMIDYFHKNSIKIIDIQCGGGHNVFCDDNGKVYSFGFNVNGECGHDSKDNILIPKQINKLKTECIVTIKCGSQHSYALSKGNNHYFWGRNRHNQCIVDTNYKCIKSPYLMNEILKKQTNNKIIKDIFLGQDITQIIVYE